MRGVGGDRIRSCLSSRCAEARVRTCTTKHLSHGKNQITIWEYKMATIIELSLFRGSLLATVPDCLTRFEAVLVNKPTGAPHVRQWRRPRWCHMQCGGPLQFWRETSPYREQQEKNLRIASHIGAIPKLNLCLCNTNTKCDLCLCCTYFLSPKLVLCISTNLTRDSENCSRCDHPHRKTAR